MEDPYALVTVATFRDPWDAHIARGRLNAEDVLAFVAHENHIWMKWPISQAIGGVKLQVPAHACEEALQILAALRAGEFDDLLDDYEPVFPTAPCPICGSDDPKRVFPLDRLLLLYALWTIGIIFPIYRNQQRCKNCGELRQI